MVRGGVALLPDEDNLLELVAGGAKDGQAISELGQKLGLVGRVHLQ